MADRKLYTPAAILLAPLAGKSREVIAIHKRILHGATIDLLLSEMPVELPTEGDRLDELLYVGLTRATTELVVIAPPELARRLG